MFGVMHLSTPSCERGRWHGPQGGGHGGLLQSQTARPLVLSPSASWASGPVNWEKSSQPLHLGWGPDASCKVRPSRAGQSNLMVTLSVMACLPQAPSVPRARPTEVLLGGPSPTWDLLRSPWHRWGLADGWTDGWPGAGDGWLGSLQGWEP